MLVRYADDVVVMCASRAQAEAALARLTALLAELGLEPKAAKTRIVQLEVGGEGLDFLGFHHRLVERAGRRTGQARHLPRPLAREQGDAARPRPDPGTHGPVPAAAARRGDRGGRQPVPPRLGRVLPSTATRHDTSTRSGATCGCGWRSFIAKRHRRSRAFGWSVVGYASPNQLGLISLDGNRRRTQTLPGLAGDTECRR